MDTVVTIDIHLVFNIYDGLILSVSAAKIAVFMILKIHTQGFVLEWVGRWG